MKKMMTIVGAAACALPLFAKIEMGTPFSDHAVLQRGMKVPVWGKVIPEADAVPPCVTVSFAGQKKVAAVDGATGAWKVELDPLEASKEPRTLTVTEGSQGWLEGLFGSAANAVEVKDVLVGEVWFASGQSNMECPIWGGNPRYRDGNGALVLEMTKLPNVRYCKNPHKWSVSPSELKAQWRTMTPENLREVRFSAVAFYYARELYLALDMPVGIVDSCWGGTNIDAWTPRCGYENCDPSIKATANYPVKENWNKKTDERGPIGRVHQQPTVLFNGMVASFAPMAMRGFIWYQGCHNSGEPALYCAKMHALYNGWSRMFGNPDLKIYLVQLAPWRSNWLGMVAAQNKFVAEQPHAAIAVAADVGNFDDIHPNRKEIVSKRLAAHALKRDYGFDIPEDDSPVFKSVRFDGAKAELTFDHVKSWYIYSPDRQLTPPFELAGEDGVWNAAKIENLKAHHDKAKKQDVKDPFVNGENIVLTSDKVSKPVKVRYMGKARTMGTLYNEMSLPLGPFEAK